VLACFDTVHIAGGRLSEDGRRLDPEDRRSSVWLRWCRGRGRT
jgi:hypothetical protein